MVSIGRGRGPLINRPNNAGLGYRANRQVNHLAAAQAAKYTNALAVDGTPVYFWHKTSGIIPCSCSAAPQTQPGNSIEQLDPEDAGGPDTSTASVGDINEVSQSRYRGTGTRFLGDFVQEPALQRVPEKLKPAPLNPALDFAGPEDFDDLDAALHRTESAESTGTTAFDDPFNLFSGKILECPVCLGTGYIDSWQLLNGARVVLDTSAEHRFRCDGVDVDDSRNPTALLYRTDEAWCTWRIKLPRTWLAIVRLAVYNRDVRISADAYRWTWTNTRTGETGPVNPAALDTQRDTADTLEFRLTAPDGLEMTHAELCWSYAPPLYAQFPELDQVYEDEFLDWNVSLSVELPLVDAVSEGDYVADARYHKVWKINRLMRKRTSDGTAFGMSSDIRALHTFEKLAGQLNLFENPREAARALKQMAQPQPQR